MEQSCTNHEYYVSDTEKTDLKEELNVINCNNVQLFYY